MSTGVYATTLPAQSRGPAGVLERGGAATSTGSPHPTACSTTRRPPFYRWFPGGDAQHLLQRARPARRRGPRRPGRAHLRLAGHRDRSAPSRMPSCSTDVRRVRRCARGARGREGRPGRHLHADGPRGGRRDAGLRADRRGALGGLRRVRPGRARGPDRRRRAEGGRLRVAAASSRAGSSSTSRCSTAGARSSPPRPDVVRGPAARAGAAAELGERDVDWADVRVVAGGRRRRRLRRGRPRPTRSTSSTPRARPGSRRASSATTAATRSRCAGRWSNIYDVRPGRGVVDGLRRRLGRRPLLHRLRAAAGRRDHGPLRGQAGRHARRGRVLAGHRRARRRGAVHRADRIRAIKKEDPDRRAGRRLRPVVAARRCSWPASGSTPRPTQWAHRPARRPGRRQLVADRDRLADRGQPARPRAAADQARLAVGAGARVRRARSSTRRARRSTPGVEGAHLPPAADAARARCRRCGATTTATSRRTCRRSTATTCPATAGYLDEDGYLFVMGRTDDVINVAGHRLSTGSMEAVLAGHPAVAECAVIGVADELKGQVPRGLVVLKAGVDAEPTGSGSARAGARSATRSAPVAALRRSTSSPRCRRPGPGRSCARRCARSPTARRPATPSTIEDASVLERLTPVLRGS